MIDLKDTIALMVSKNYKERFVAEYIQLKTRYDKLKTFCHKIQVAEMTGTEEPKHDCPLELLQEQLSVMDNYLNLLELRSRIEHINLPLMIKNIEEGIELANKPIDISGDETKPVDIQLGDTDGDTKAILKEKRTYKKQATSEVID